MIEKIEIGDTIQIIATDPGVLHDIPNFQFYLLFFMSTIFFRFKVKPSKRIIFFPPLKQSRQFFHHKQAPCAHAPVFRKELLKLS
jgi:hypothetical protein